MFVSCHKSDQPSASNAEIIGFNPEKCMCCWGWTIKIGDDTIKTRDTRLAGLAGYDITTPVPVYIELGARDKDCATYFQIIQIEVVKP